MSSQAGAEASNTNSSNAAGQAVATSTAPAPPQVRSPIHVTLSNDTVIDIDYPAPSHNRTQVTTEPKSQQNPSHNRTQVTTEQAMNLVNNGGHYRKDRGNPPMRANGTAMPHFMWSDHYNDTDTKIYNAAGGKPANASTRSSVERQTGRTRDLAIEILIKDNVLDANFRDNNP